jgi:hypothetical protein
MGSGWVAQSGCVPGLNLTGCEKSHTYSLIVQGVGSGEAISPELGRWLRFTSEMARSETDTIRSGAPGIAGDSIP